MALVTALLIPMTLLQVAPAQAATDRGSTKNEQCFVPYETQQLHCVSAGADLRAEISKVTGHPVVFAGDATASKLQPSGIASATTATIIVGYLWENENYGGSNVAFTVDSSSATPCVGTTWTFNYLGNIGWHDRADSMKSASGCRMNLYADPNYVGAQTGWQYQLASLGVMHDAGDSLRFTS